ncbi:MAG: 50S ribosomal protein L4 [Candidatus Glassbacteria bacterium]|nr:50S ribosomal protein L4 [Candidatus Glassbacteria bacterium]
MKRVAVLKENGEKAGRIGLPDSYFGTDPSEAAVYYSVNATLTNKRQGDANTKTRSEVNYSTSKPWRQKGTGRARAGTRRSPIWRGGGTTFGPLAKDYDVRVPRKVRRKALASALSAKAAEDGAVVVVEDLTFDEPKTSRAAALLDCIGAGEGKVLVMVDGGRQMAWKSMRNIARVAMKNFTDCNAYDVLLADKLVIEKSVIKKLKRVGNEGSASDHKTAAAD